MSKIRIKNYFLETAIKYFGKGGFSSESVGWRQTKNFLRMAWDFVTYYIGKQASRQAAKAKGQSLHCLNTQSMKEDESS